MLNIYLQNEPMTNTIAAPIKQKRPHEMLQTPWIILYQHHAFYHKITHAFYDSNIVFSLETVICRETQLLFRFNPPSPSPPLHHDFHHIHPFSFLPASFTISLTLNKYFIFPPRQKHTHHRIMTWKFDNHLSSPPRILNCLRK